jgi:hypothetical protein
MKRVSALALLAIALAGCGEKDEPEPTTPPPATTTTATSPPTDRDDKPEDGGRDAGGPSRAERAALRTVRRYVSALDERDGAAVCRLLAPGVIGEVKLPRERGSCAASLEASIGYRDPRGLPQFAGVNLTEANVGQLRRDRARVTASLVTEFADRPEPSVEEDFVYLERAGARWLIAQPSVALYRAIGAEPGPRSIAPPG